MKKFFSIIINHDYDRVDTNTLGISNDLAIIPARTSHAFVKKNRLLFRNQNGLLDCFIEDDDKIKSEVSLLFFWVVCVNEAFYSYTAYPDHINFSNPYYYWSNSRVRTSLLENEFCDMHPGLPPKQAVGCIGVLINSIDASEKLEFTIDFKIRKTFWEYHVFPKQEQDAFTKLAKAKIAYSIIDSYFEQKKADDNWEFAETSESKSGEIVYRSKIPLAFSKNATDRLRLVWGQEPSNPLQEDQEMTLPFPNYTYKTVNKDNNELTPIYIHI
jgi:hypothetical protein